jgi:hypothetical protein
LSSAAERTRIVLKIFIKGIGLGPKVAVKFVELTELSMSIKQKFGSVCRPKSKGSEGISYVIE